MTSAIKRLGPITKRDLLLFDEIHVMGLEELLGTLADRSPQDAAELEFLANRNIVFDAPNDARDLAHMIRSTLRQDLEPILADFERFEIEWPVNDGSRRDSLIQAELLASTAGHPAYVPYSSRPLPLGGELLVSFAERLAGEPSVPVLPRELSKNDWHTLSRAVMIPRAVQSRGVRSAQVLDLVVKRLPLPGDASSYEDILEFRSDPEVRDKARDLRHWVEKIARGDSSIDDADEELDELLHDFERHMALYRMKAQASFLRVALSIPLSVAEELLHLRPKQALDTIFEFRQRSADRLEAELSSPGHEVAYIEAARRRFS